MVSLKNSRSFASTPVVVYGFVVLNVAIYLYEVSLDSAAFQQFLALWAIIPQQLTMEIAGEPLTSAYEWLTLLTFQFLHAGWFHLVGNLFCLWAFGRSLETRWGHTAFLAFYLIGGGLSGIAQWLVAPSSAMPILGASGAIAGIMGAYVVCFPRAKIALFFVGFWFAQQVFYSALSWENAALSNTGLGSSMEMIPVNIAYAAHAGGFIFGVAFSAIAGLLASSRSRYLR